jgi:HAMP domain-containing protein
LAAWLSGATIFAFLVYLAIAIYVWRWPQQQIDAMARLYEEDEPCKREKP